MLFRRIVLASLLLGLVSGGLLGVLQAFITTPIIIAAEAYEANEGIASGGGLTSSEPGEHTHGDGWAPHDGLERTLYSMLATVVIACAYALLLLSAISFRGTANWQTGIVWGLAGYTVFFIAPSLGLPPEIPGVQAAPLEGRQVWWLSTIGLTAAGLGVLAFGKKHIKLAAIPLLLAPHLIGAPQPAVPGFANNTPDAVSALTALEQTFFIATAITLGIFWVVLGSLSGYLTLRYINRPDR